MNDYTKSIVWEVLSSPPPSGAGPVYFHELNLHPLVERLLVARGITTLEEARGFLDPRHYSPAPSSDLPDLASALAILEDVVKRRQPVLVWGDFDADGLTATALLVSSLQTLQVPVTYYIPNRAEESHGIGLTALHDQLERFSPAVLLTCDTGVSAFEAIDYTKSHGIATIITDHHDLPPALPAADAVINPKRLPSYHALASLPGVGVAYKLAESLLTRFGQDGQSAALTDLVALGIVADVARLHADTRYLLQIGLAQLRRDQRPGLSALYRLAQLNPERLTETEIAFQIAPRLNAAGRLDDARLVVELLTTTDQEQAEALALRLDGLNRQRQLYERQILAAAQAQLDQDPSLLDWRALVLHNPNWHPGVLGIVANRLAALYRRPVVLLASKGDIARGSARSALGYDIHAAIAAQNDLLLSFGGHPGAAGLALPADQIAAFRRRLSDTLANMPTAPEMERLAIDAMVPLSDVTIELANALQRLAPFGEGNPRPILACERLSLLGATSVGREREHRRLTVEDEQGNRRDVLWWNGANDPLPPTPFDLAFHIEISQYRDQTELQLTLVGFRPSPVASITVSAPARQVIDRRTLPPSAQALAALRAAYPDALIWAEGYRRSEAPGIPLSALHPTKTLLVYTAPCGPYALAQALQKTSAQCVVLVGIDPPLTQASAILRRILELVKHVLAHQEGRVSLQDLAEAVAQPERVIRLALRYAQSGGVLNWEEEAAGMIVLSHPPSGADKTDGDPTLWAAFQAQVAETAAYRAYFRHAATEQLLAEEHSYVLPDSSEDDAH